MALTKERLLEEISDLRGFQLYLIVVVENYRICDKSSYRNFKILL